VETFARMDGQLEIGRKRKFHTLLSTHASA
jgi:hypothetical protein